MEAFLNQVRRAAQEAANARAVTRHGVITSYDPTNHAVKVQLQPDGTLTGWIPLKSAWVGNGWGLFLAPQVGTAVQIDFQEADGGVGSAGLSFFNDVERPLSVPAGEAWLVHKSGASIKLTNDAAVTIANGQGALISLAHDGTIKADTGAGASIQLKGGDISSKGTWAHEGALNVTGGTVTSDQDVVGGGKSLKNHIHTAVKTGTDTSGPPQ
jgi:phage baseplate assembly protein V